MLLGA